MAINFPHNPNINDVHTEASLGRSWKWDGTTWKIYSSTTTGIAFGDLSVSQQAASGTGSLTYNNAGVFTYTPPVVGSGGSSAFTGLSDTPGSLTAGKWLKVNAGGTALEWTDAPAGNDTNDYLNTASLSGNTLILTRTGTQALLDVTVDLSSLNPVPTNITVADESTDTECYPLFSKDATGNIEPKTGSNIKFNSSSGQLEAGSFKKTGGTSSEFLKADGSVDSSTYSSFSGSYNDLTNKPTIPAAQIQSDWNQTDSNHTAFIQNKPTIPAAYGNSDVDTHLNQSGPTSGYVLSWNGSDYEWVAQSGGGGGSGGGNVAVGSIMIWSGTANAIPTGWQLCDGSNGSPDLRDKFVIGAGNNYNVAATGGSKDAIVVQHNHGISDSGHDHRPLDASTVQNYEIGVNPNTEIFAPTMGSGVSSNNSPNTSDSTTGITINNEGSSGSNANLPPYYALCYIYCTAAGSNQTFVGLDGTPSSFTANKWLKVNSGGTALEWTDAPVDNDTTYSQQLLVANATPSSVQWDLVPSVGTADSITLTAGTNISFSAATADGVTINASGGGATINNNGDNRLITGSATTGELNAESSLTYDGTKLNFSNNGKITFGNNLRMEVYTDGSVNYIKSATDGGGAFPISIHSGSDEVINIDDGHTQIKTGIKDKDGDLGTSGQILSSTGTQVNWIDAPAGNNTTYDLSGVATGSGVKIRLTGSDSTTDDVEFTPAGGISYSVSGNTVEISSVNTLTGLTDTNITSSPNTGDVLVYQNSKWEAGTASGAGDIPSGSIMLFYQSSAPTGWTKQTDHNNKALRVVSGNGGGTGGSVGFTSAFANHTVSISGSDTVNISDSDSVSISGNCGGSQSIYWNTTQAFLTVAQMPAHQHDYDVPRGTSGGQYGFMDTSNAGSSGTQKVVSTGGSDYHTHAIIMQYVNGSNFSFSGSDTVNISGSDTVNISGSDSVNTAVQYLDVIICSKN